MHKTEKGNQFCFLESLQILFSGCVFWVVQQRSKQDGFLKKKKIKTECLVLYFKSGTTQKKKVLTMIRCPHNPESRWLSNKAEVNQPPFSVPQGIHKTWPLQYTLKRFPQLKVFKNKLAVCLPLPHLFCLNFYYEYPAFISNQNSGHRQTFWWTPVICYHGNFLTLGCG